MVNQFALRKQKKNAAGECPVYLFVYFDCLGFNALTTGGAPAASVAYLDRYTSQAFTFTHAGVAHTGAFTATVNF